MADDPGTPTTFWIDVSHHDWNRRGGNLDWTRVLAQTSPVMCARATYGDPAGWNRVTHRFADFQSGAAAAGFTVRGGYHNLIRGDANSMMRQADWLSRTIDAQACNWGMADIERYAELVSAGLWPRWQDVLRFRDAWYATPRPRMSWYLPQWVYHSSGFSGGDLNELPGLHIQSHYAGGNGTLHQIYANAGGDSGIGWDDCFGNRCPDAWQFTAVANVDGASDQTDVNAFRGTLEQLSALLTQGGQDAMSAKAEAQIDALFHAFIPDPPMRVQGQWTSTGPDGRSRPINPLYNVLDRHAEILEKIAAKVGFDENELAQIREAARLGAEAGVVASADELVAAFVGQTRNRG